MDWSNRFSQIAKDAQTSEIRELLKLLADPEILSFAGGIPDPALFPIAGFQRISNAIAADPSRNRQALQYAPTEGYVPLRTWAAERANAPELALDIDNVLITNGAQQGLTLLAAALIDIGTPIAVAAPTYLGALQVFETRQPRIITVATDTDGLRLDALEAAFREEVRFLYTIPDFQNPGGFSQSEERRAGIVALAHRYGVPILEDTAYRDLYYDAPPPPSLLQMEARLRSSECSAGSWREKGLVVQLGTASKTLMPALRIGWVIAPLPIMEKLIVLKQADDLNTSSLNQMLTHDLATTILNDHVAMLRSIYGERRDILVETLRQHLPNDAHFTTPKGGMFVWLTLPTGVDARDLLQAAITEEKIAFVPGTAFHAHGGGENTLRLSFSTCQPDDIRRGMETLCALIRRLENDR